MGWLVTTVSEKHLWSYVCCSLFSGPSQHKDALSRRFRNQSNTESVPSQTTSSYLSQRSELEARAGCKSDESGKWLVRWCLLECSLASSEWLLLMQDRVMLRSDHEYATNERDLHGWFLYYALCEEFNRTNYYCCEIDCADAAYCTTCDGDDYLRSWLVLSTLESNPDVKQSDDFFCFFSQSHNDKQINLLK